MSSPETKSKKKSGEVIKVLLSIWAIFHVFAVLITPNRNTYLGGLVSGVIEPYANFLELSANWNFFAPQPGPPIRLEYEALDSDGDQVAHDFWPALSSPWRQTTLSHFVMKDPNGGDRLVGNFLCLRNPGSRSIRMWRNTYVIPTPEDVKRGKRKIGDDTQVVRQFMGEWACARPSDPAKNAVKQEVSL